MSSRQTSNKREHVTSVLILALNISMPDNNFNKSIFDCHKQVLNKKLTVLEEQICCQLLSIKILSNNDPIPEIAPSNKSAPHNKLYD